jgi:hypothetical protein
MSIATPPMVPPDQEEIEYPASDGEPMAETGLHVQAILLLFQALEDALAATDFIAADMFCSGTGRRASPSPASRPT